jgi:hypothetical protein
LHLARPSSSNDELFAQARQTIRVLLDHELLPDRAPLTRERLYAVTRYLISAANRAADLFNVLTLELEKTVSGMNRRLREAAHDVSFLHILAGEVSKFERQVNNVRGALAHLDRTYIIDIGPGESIRSVTDVKPSGCSN